MRLIAALMLMAGVATAKEITLECDPPTQNVDGSPITGTLQYEFRVGPVGGVMQTITVSGPSATGDVPVNVPLTSNVRAINSVGEVSDWSEAFDWTELVAPGAPTNLRKRVEVAANEARGELAELQAQYDRYRWWQRTEKLIARALIEMKEQEIGRLEGLLG